MRGLARQHGSQKALALIVTGIIASTPDSTDWLDWVSMSTMRTLQPEAERTEAKFEQIEILARPLFPLRKQ
jgi:hypothetical protein